MLTTSQEIIYLGSQLFVNDAIPSRGEMEDYHREMQDGLVQEIVSVLALARRIGRMTAASHAIKTTPLRYRDVKNKAFKHT